MIRKAEASDLEALMGIWLDANVQAHSFIPAGHWQGCYAAVREMLPQAELYVHQGAAGEADAFLGLQGDYIAGLFVREEARGRGAGKQLLDQAKAIRPRLALHVYQKNTRAVSFYEREGFAVCEAGVDESTGEAEWTMTWQRRG